VDVGASFIKRAKRGCPIPLHPSINTTGPVVKPALKVKESECRVKIKAKRERDSLSKAEGRVQIRGRHPHHLCYGKVEN